MRKSIWDRLKNKSRARQMVIEQERLLKYLHEQELRYHVIGLVRHIDTASHGTRSSSQSTLEERLMNSKLTQQDRLLLWAGSLVVFGYLVAKWL